VLPIGHPSWGAGKRQPGWVSATEPLEMTGRQLAVIGLRPPSLHPESSLVVHLDGGHAQP
jgi:hypothetical protein